MSMTDRQQSDGYRRVVSSLRHNTDAVAKLDALVGDPEADHGEAEAILCELLRSIGFGEAADAFERAKDRVGFWYA